MTIFVASDPMLDYLPAKWHGAMDLTAVCLGIRMTMHGYP
jgi:hypothetical protein